MKLQGTHIDETIVHLLLRHSPLTTGELIQKIRLQRGSVTKQGVYRSLRKLRAEEKVVMYRASVSINELWATHMRTLFGKRNRPSLIGDLLHLEEGERIFLKLKSLTHIDQVWSDIFITIEKGIPRKHPLYLFNPHNWFIILRPVTEQLHIKRLSSQRRMTFLNIGSLTPLDKETIKAIRNSQLKCSPDPKLTHPDYIAVISDYLIRVQLSQKDNRTIDEIFKKEKTIGEASIALSHIDTRVSGRIIIEHNKKKSHQWKKRLAKNFYVPKEMRDFK